MVLEKYKSNEQDIKEIEEKLIANKSYTDPLNAAANMYGLYMPKFKQGVDMLSSKALRRLIKALIEYPLEEAKYNHSTPLEKQLMSIGHAVLEAKFLMILETYNNHMSELQEALDPNTEAVLTDEEKQELEKYTTPEGE